MKRVLTAGEREAVAPLTAAKWMMDLPSVEAASSVFVNGLDRSALGSHAVPLDVLAAVDLCERLGRDVGSFIKTVGAGYGRDHADGHVLCLSVKKLYSRTAYQARKLCDATETDIVDAEAEMVFWWSLFDKPLLAEVTMHRVTRAQLDRLSVMYAHPEMLGYFEAGIWDLSYVERCLAGGVDPSLAVTLSAA